MTNNISKKVVSTCFIAGCLEIYDFTIFGYLANHFHKNYFSFLSKNNALIITYILFAVGFLFRPLGAILFGYIGDSYGRKKALIISVTIMGLASLGMSVLPSYATLGILSCYILAFLRILQGISVGGEYSGAIIYAVESNINKNAGTIGSIVVCGCMTGVLLATLVNNILNSAYIPSFAWRLAFLLGFLLSFIGFFIRTKLDETIEFKQLGIIKSKIPLIESIKKYKIKCLCTVFVAATNGVNLYFMTVYLPNYLKVNLDKQLTFIAPTLTCLVALFTPFFGYLSDKYFIRKYLIIMGMSFLSLYAILLLPMFYSSTNTKLLIFLTIIYSIILSMQSGTSNTFIVEIFPTRYRFICTAFCYSIGMGIIGGSSPMIASLITKYIGDKPLYVSIYISIISLLGCLAVLIIPYKQNHQEV